VLIPVSDAVKSKVDVGVGGSAVLGYFKAIPWPEIAAFLAVIYTALRIIELLWDRWHRK
jgi:hypothetical protein